MDDVTNFGLMVVFGIAIVLVVAGIPIYVLNSLAKLRHDVEYLRDKLAHLEREALSAHGPLSPVTMPPLASARQEEFVFAVPAMPSPPEPFTPLVSSPVSPIRTSALAGLHRAETVADEPRLERKLDIESVLGANWLAKLGIGAIALATAFFLQYAFREKWIGPVGQVAIGLMVAAILTVTGHYLLKREQYRNYAQTLTAGGMIVYYLSIYAAYSFYHTPVIGFGPAFALLAAGALAISALAISDNTEAVAAICILGAFATPVLIRQNGMAGAHHPIALYAYLVFLNLWVVGLTRVRPWHSLSVLAFAGTWLIFYQASPLKSSGWETDGFASLFLLASCYLGARVLYNKATNDKAATSQELLNNVWIGMGLIIGGCAAFGYASSLILDASHLIALPDIAIIGLLLGVLLAAMGIALPAMGSYDRPIRLALGYLAAAVMAIMLAASLDSSTVIPASQIPLAFGFILINYLVFLLAGLAQYRQKEIEAPAAAMIAANTIIHIEGSWQVLRGAQLWSMPALALWMPLAGCIALGALWWVSLRQGPESRLFSGMLAASAQLLPLCGLLSVIPGVTENAVTHWPIWSAAVFGMEFLLVSVSWLLLRRRLAWPELRIDLLSAIGNAAVFFGLFALAIRERQFAGLDLLAGYAILMAAYHAIIGRVVLRSDDSLRRLIYYGLAVTFVAIAIPLQLHAGYITAAWAVQAAALVWIGLRANERRVRWYGLSLLAIAGCRNLLFDFPTSPRHFTLILNSRTMAGAAVIVAAYLCAWWLGKRRDALTAEERDAPWVLSVAANLFTLLFVSADLWDYAGIHWPAGGTANAQQLALSLFWTGYALACVSVGMWKQLRPVRLFSMGLLCFSILKVVLFDLSNLATPYRIASFFALGVILLLVSLMYTKFESRVRA